MIARLLEELHGAEVQGRKIRDWSLYSSESNSLSLGIKDEQAGNAHTPLSLAQGGGVRYLFVWDDGKVSRGHFERRQCQGDPLEALGHARNAAYRDDDAAQVAGPAEIPEVALFDESTADMAGGETGRFAPRLQAIRECVRREQLRTWSGSFSAAAATVRLITSAGLDVCGTGTSTGWHVTFNGEVGDGFGARRPDSDEDYLERLQRLVRLVKQLDRDATPVQPGVHTVILHPRVVQGYALDTLWTHLDGSTVDHGEGRFARADFGSDRALLRSDISLRLDPLQPFLSGSYRFSGEGVPAARCSFVESGRLIQPVLGLKFARRLKLPPTPIPYASDVLDFGTPTRLDMSAALRRAEGGALVLSALGIHTQDSSNGDFSLSAPQTLSIADGDFAGRMRATISGNLFDLLNDESTAFVDFEGERIPGMLIACRLDPK